MNMNGAERRPVQKSLKEYARGIAGGLLFSFPLLYTMEVWWSGTSASPLQLLLLVFTTYLLLLGYNRFAGMRADASWRNVMIDSVEEMGIGLLLAFIILLMLNRIDLHDMVLSEIMGKVMIEAMFVSIGVSIGTAQLGAIEEDAEEREIDVVNEFDDKTKSWSSSKISLVVLAVCGSIIVGGNVAPTEEVLLIAIAAKPGLILGMAVLSICISTVIMFFSDFKNARQTGKEGFLINFLSDTCLSYIVALSTSAFCL